MTTEAELYAMPRNLVLAASAGTGKTHALVGVVVHLLIGGRPDGAVDPSRIVATTFSRKAAAEIRARVVSEIERLVLAPSSSVYVDGLRASLNEAGGGGGGGGTSRGRVSDEELSKRARKALSRLPHARFGTLHSFATGIVQRYAVELGLGPGFELATEADSRARADDAIARALEKRLVNQSSDLRALAEAAGGIDRLVSSLRRVLNQLEEDGRSARDLEIDASDARVIEAQMNELVGHARTIVTNTRCEAAAREMTSAWDAEQAQTQVAAPASRSGSKTEGPPPTVSIDESLLQLGGVPSVPRLELAAAGLTGLAARGKKPPEVEAFFVFRNDLQGTPNDEKGRRLARAWRSRHLFARYAQLVRDVLAEAETDIERLSREHATLGFGEVLRGARELLRDRPDVADEVSAGIEALLVDEFQDTSRVQRDLLQLLWARPEARSPVMVERAPIGGRLATAARPRSPAGTNTIPPLSAMRPRGLLVVGDRKQSIYGFRGADVGVFAELAVGLAGAPAREALGIPAGVTWEPKEPLADFHALRHNRRSVPSILAFANAFSRRRFQTGDPPPELFEIEYVPRTEDLLSPSEPIPTEPDEPIDDTPLLLVMDEAGGSATGTSVSEDDKAKEDRPATTWLRVRPKGATSTRLEEALVITEHVQAILRTQEPRLGEEKRAPTLRDMAVLATTNGMLDAVAFALAQSDIPYVVAGKSFFRAREISDLSAMLSIVLDPNDRLAILEVLRGPWASVHDETLLGLVEPGKGLVSPDRWASSPPSPHLIHDEDRPALTRLASLVLDLGRCAGRLGAGAILREAIGTTGFESVLRAMPRGQQRVANVQKLLTMADRHPDARAFRSWLEDAKEQEVGESEAATFSDADDAVRLLTVHASKGLDFPIVFVPEIGASLPRTDKGVARVALGAGDTPNVLSVRIADDVGYVLEPPSYTRAYTTTKRRERAERQRLAYVAITRAADAMFLVGGRTRETVLDPGASTLAVVESLPRHLLGIVGVEPPTPTPTPSTSKRAPEDDPAAQPQTSTSSADARSRSPDWRILPIAPTALADFDHCKRRFELLHVLGLPEQPRGQKKSTSSSSSSTSSDADANLGADESATETLQAVDPSALDIRAQGTIAHAVLEHLPYAAFFAAEDAIDEVTRSLTNAGVSKDHPQHAAIARRVMRFLRTRYVRSIHEGGAKMTREVPFILPIEDAHGRVVTLRGSMDLVVSWPDGAVDVIDYKSARKMNLNNTGHTFQLDVYALAARALFKDAKRHRAGLAFLGGGTGEPVWCELPNDDKLRAHIGKLGADLMAARWTATFPRVVLERCEAIHCGFIGRCHPDR